MQALGDDLAEIMENQRQLEAQLDQLVLGAGKGGGEKHVPQGLKEDVHGLTAAAQGTTMIQ